MHPPREIFLLSLPHPGHAFAEREYSRPHSGQPIGALFPLMFNMPLHFPLASNYLFCVFMAWNNPTQTLNKWVVAYN